MIDKYSIFHMQAAMLYSKLSYARRAKVGSVLVSPDNTRILMIGYNGRVAGGDNNCEYSIVDNKKDDDVTLSYNEMKTRDDVIHAEANVLLYCAKHGIKTDNCILYITLSPCMECAKMIITAGIKSVFYNEEYRDISKVKSFLEANKVNIKQIKI